MAFNIIAILAINSEYKCLFNFIKLLLSNYCIRIKEDIIKAFKYVGNHPSALVWPINC